MSDRQPQYPPLSRRRFIHASALAAVGAATTACSRTPPEPQQSPPAPARPPDRPRRHTGLATPMKRLASTENACRQVTGAQAAALWLLTRREAPGPSTAAGFPKA